MMELLRICDKILRFVTGDYWFITVDSCEIF